MTTYPLNDHAALVDLTVNQLYLYDQAVRSWMESINSRTGVGTHLNVVIATPDRAFATLERMWKKKYTQERVEKLKLAPYPIASIARMAHRYDPTRYRGRQTKFRRVTYSEDLHTTYNVLYPRPWDFDYQIELSAKNAQTMSLLTLWLMEQATEEVFLRINFTPLWKEWGVKLVAGDIPDITDNSDLEPDEKQRELRTTVSMTLHGWLFLPPEPVGVVLTIVQDAYMAATNADLSGADAATIDSDADYQLGDSIEYDEDGIK
jgi:hypothetical protein